ncbi:hypothetical protein F1728_19865 [Gimesia benthica]|uniref:Uncharacterized protein n=1 Tax=Gimesia benthica TaxID=2608982 RepID=A0A6I6AED0_9PLAN|nr:hypothetical protein [Gimesia benthica]QGQ24803.1 hypothetical protein F1728_19865 [Gimesia benthica]
MFRKTVSLILIPFVMLTQSVAFGHAHADNQPAGHDLRVHIHLNSSEADAEHGHVHSHGNHCHAHGDHAHSEQEQEPSSQLDSPFDHDSSAIYLNSTDLTSGARSNINLDVNDLLLRSLTRADSVSEVVSAYGPALREPDCAPPDTAAPLFLRHHAILI